MQILLMGQLISSLCKSQTSHGVFLTFKPEQNTKDFHTFEKVPNVGDSDQNKQTGILIPK